MTKLFKSYSELIQIPTFEERYEYLRIRQIVGENVDTMRWLKQQLYRSYEWKVRVRSLLVVRDNGCDLGVLDRAIAGKIYLHHINPVTVEDIEQHNPIVFDPENLICCSFDTHNAIHYGDKSLLLLDPIERKPGDTCPWRR